MLAAVLGCAMTLWAQGPLKKTKMSPWLLNKYQQQQTAVKQNGGPLKVKGRTVRNYILTLVESTDEAAAIRAKGGVVFQDFGQGICAAFLPTDSLGVLDECPTILCMEANEAPTLMNDTSAILTGVTKAWDFENNLPSDLKPQTSSIPQAFTGKGVIAAVEDGGFDFTHPAFRNDDGSSRIKWFWDMMVESDNPNELGQIYTTPEQVLAAQYCTDAETGEHGTHVMGTMAGRGLNGRYVGMAPEADIMGVYDGVGHVTAEFKERLSNYLKSHLEDFSPFADEIIQVDLNQVMDLVSLKKIFDAADAAGQPCVVNWSFGTPPRFYHDITMYKQVFDQLVGPGHIVVESAGNSGGYMTYVKKEADMAMNQDYHYAGTATPLVFDFRIALDVPSFQVKYTIDGVADTLAFDIEEVIEAYVKGDTYKIKFPEGVMDICIYPVAYGLVGLNAEISFTDDFMASKTDANGFIRLDGRILIDDPVEVEIISFRTNTRMLLFSMDLPDVSRGCNLGTLNLLACMERIIAVGAMHHRTSFTNILGEPNTYAQVGSEEGHLLSYSSCGPGLNGRTKPDVVAPGHNIISALNSFYRVNGDDQATHDMVSPLTAYKANVFGKDYAMWVQSGTSMAAPMVSGIIALWLQAKPDLTPEDILGVIARTSHQPEPEFSGNEKNNYYGYGEIDAYAGLLDILKLTDIPELSHHQPAGLTFRVEGHTLYIDGLDGEAPITLFDLSGRPVLQTVTSGTLQLPNLAAGVYAVQLGQLGSTLIRL